MKMSCPSCGEDFERFQNRQRFCSKKCKQRNDYKNFYAKHRERKLAKNRAYFYAHHEEGLRYRREWHSKHREEQNTRKRQWYEEHREYASEKMKRYRAENREVLSQKSKEKYQKEAPKIRAQIYAYRRENPEKVKMIKSKSHQKSRLTHPWSSLLKSAEDRAKKKNLPFSLTEAWASERWTGSCEVSGLSFQLGQRKSGPKFYSPSIDKIEAGLGYTQANCRFVLWAVNSFKHDGTDEDMYLVAEAILKNRTKSNS